MKIRTLMLMMIIAATTSYSMTREEVVNKIKKNVSDSITKAMEEDPESPYINKSTIYEIENTINSAIKDDIEHPQLSELDIPEINLKINKVIDFYKSGITSKPLHRIIQTSEYNIDPIEQGAYQNFLRVVDAQNKMNGIDSNYWNKGSKKSKVLHDDVDLVPVAHVTLNNDDKVNESGSNSLARKNSHAIYDLAERGNEAFSDIERNSLAYKNSTFYDKRFYFGNGNTLKDIVFLNDGKFQDEVTKAEKNKNEKYLIEGTYNSIKDKDSGEEEENVNLLNISTKEFKSKIDGKSRGEVVGFIKNKMEAKGITGLVQKGEELYTVDSKGREWKVLWHIEPVSLFRPSDEKFKDTVYTNIHVYREFDKNLPTHQGNKVLYTNDNSIYSQDKNKYNADLSLKLIETETIVTSEIKTTIKINKVEYDTELITPIDDDDPEDPDSEEYHLSYYQNRPNEFRIVNGKAQKILEKLSRVFDINDTEEINKFKQASSIYRIAEFDEEAPVETTIRNSRTEKKDVTKTLADFIETAKKRAENGEAPRNKFDEYFNDKKNLSQTDFEDKWIKPFQDNDYKTAKINYEKELADAKAKKEVVEKERTEAQTKIDFLHDNGRPSDFYGMFDWIGKNQQEREDYLNTLSEVEKQWVKDYVKANEDFEKLDQEDTQLGEAISSGIAKKYGFWDSPLASPNEKKYVFDGSIADMLFVRELAGKNVEFRGRGRVEGIVDLGEGKNKLVIAEQFTGRYGTNIILGPYAKLKNIDTVEVGGALSRSGSQASISGRTGLTLDIDPNLKNTEGNYYQHALKDSDPNITFIKYGTTNMDTRNDFKIELMVSRISENKANIDIGRKIDYVLNDPLKGETYKMYLPFISDSIAHQLVDEKKLSQKGTSILGVKTKESIKRLNDQENEVYKSIRNAEKLGVLFPTLTTTNKRTVFSPKEDQTREEKEKVLIDYLLYKENNDILNDLAEFNFTDIDKQNTLKTIENIKANATYIAVKSKEEILKKQLENSTEDQKEVIRNKIKENRKNLKSLTDYDILDGQLYYTMREEEVLTELKNMLHQLSDRNIYAKLNKVSKNEISTYTNLPFEVDHSLTDKKTKAKGGFISSRTVQENFKGNIYTAYGLYEKEKDSGTAYGLMIGGANTKHEEVYKRTLTTVATESEIKGVSAYIGGYFNKPVLNNLNWVTGLGTQYGRYNVKREMRNNYQDLQSKGKVNTYGLNSYSGLVITYPIQEDVSLQIKGLLSYTMMKQNKVKESGDLPLDINSKMYHYVDGEAGVSFNKIFYGDDLRSSISAGAYGILGISGYKNSNLNAKVKDSTSSFEIKGDKVKKDAVKINIDYNVQMDNGYNYGLEGTYISNSKENNVKIGVKAGYVF